MVYAMGEDRSSFQPVGPWTRNAFGFAKATEGTGYRDPTFAANWAALKAEGKVRGAYHFFHPALNAVDQADFFVGTVIDHGYQAGDIFMADVEILAGADGHEMVGTGDAQRRMHGELLTQLGSGQLGLPVNQGARTFLDRVAALAGPSCRVLLYTDLTMAQNDLAACTGYPLFLAYYASDPPASVHPWGSWAFWQKEGGGGEGGGDLDYFSGDAASLAAWTGADSWTEVMMAELPTLQQGSKDPVGGMNMVGRVQALVAFIGQVNNLGPATQIHPSGSFDVPTRAAVMKVQAMFGLTQDGVVGPATWRKLILG